MRYRSVLFVYRCRCDANVRVCSSRGNKGNARPASSVAAMTIPPCDCGLRTGPRSHIPLRRPPRTCGQSSLRQRATTTTNERTTTICPCVAHFPGNATQRSSDRTRDNLPTPRVYAVPSTSPSKPPRATNTPSSSTIHIYHLHHLSQWYTALPLPSVHPLH